jgi:hypothetical protein
MLLPVYDRLECTALLIRQGYDPSILSTNGVSTVDITFTDEIPVVLQRDRVKRSKMSERTATALMLLQHNVDYDAGKVFGNDQYTAAITEHHRSCRARLEQQQLLLGIHASNTHEVSNSAKISTVDNSIVKVQLMHADTGVKSDKVYTLDTDLLAELHKVTATSNSSVLLIEYDCSRRLLVKFCNQQHQ